MAEKDVVRQIALAVSESVSKLPLPLRRELRNAEICSARRGVSLFPSVRYLCRSEGGVLGDGRRADECQFLQQTYGVPQGCLQRGDTNGAHAWIPSHRRRKPLFPLIVADIPSDFFDTSYQGCATDVLLIMGCGQLVRVLTSWLQA